MKARVLRLFALAVAVARAGATADSHIVLPPQVQNASKPMKMLVFMPGGGVPNSYYVDTAKAIQAAATELQLWVVIPAVFHQLCIIECSAVPLCGPLRKTVEGALSEAKAKGWQRGKDDEDMWLVGHSLGGVCSNTLFQATASKGTFGFAGVAVFGSFVDESGPFSVAGYPKPVMVMNVEFDFAGARPGRTSLWWRQYLDAEAAKGDAFAVANKAVVVLEKMNHSDFCPGWDVPGDLPAEVDLPTAVAEIGRSVASWLHLQVPALSNGAKDAALKHLLGHVSFTRRLMAPVLRALDMERTAATSPFCSEAQHVLAGLQGADDQRLFVQDTYPKDIVGFRLCGPHSFVNADRLNVHTCSHADFDLDIANTAHSAAAKEIECKLMGGEAIAKALGLPSDGKEVPCGEVNRRAVAIAEKLALPATLDRFRQRGRGFCFEADEEASFFWDVTAMKFADNGTCLAVTSPIRSAGDNRYCKVLSPAKALDWIMTDSLIPPKAAKKVEPSSGNVLVA